MSRTNTAIGRYMRLSRRKLGYTQVEFAKLLNTDQAAVSRIESGIQAPSIKDYIKVSKMTGFDPLDHRKKTLERIERELRRG